MRPISILAGFVALLAPLYALNVGAQGEPRSLMQEEKTLVAEVVRKGLGDPGSARFRWYKFDGGKQYCGLVNVKEAGTYAGLRNFLVDVVPSSTGQIFAATNPIVIDPDSRIAQTMTKICLSTTIDEDTAQSVDPPIR